MTLEQDVVCDNAIPTLDQCANPTFAQPPQLPLPSPYLPRRSNGSLFHFSEVLAFGLVFWSVINNDDIPIHFVRDSCGGADMF
jgi:hypothetical protein